MTSFPLPWPDVLRELSAMELATQAPAVPKTGVELAETVRVLVRSGSWTKATDANRMLQHAHCDGFDSWRCAATTSSIRPHCISLRGQM